MSTLITQARTRVPRFAESDECAVFSLQIQRYRSYCEALSNLRFLVFPIVVVTRCLSLWGEDRDPNKNGYCKRSGRSNGVEKLA